MDINDIYEYASERYDGLNLVSFVDKDGSKKQAIIGFESEEDIDDIKYESFYVYDETEEDEVEVKIDLEYVNLEQAYPGGEYTYIGNDCYISIDYKDYGKDVETCDDSEEFKDYAMNGSFNIDPTEFTVEDIKNGALTRFEEKITSIIKIMEDEPDTTFVFDKDMNIVDKYIYEEVNWSFNGKRKVVGLYIK